jgi:hypothetical protein
MSLVSQVEVLMCQQYIVGYACGIHYQKKYVECDQFLDDKLDFLAYHPKKFYREWKKCPYFDDNGGNPGVVVEGGNPLPCQTVSCWARRKFRGFNRSFR